MPKEQKTHGAIELHGKRLLSSGSYDFDADPVRATKALETMNEIADALGEIVIVATVRAKGAKWESDETTAWRLADGARCPMCQLKFWRNEWRERVEFEPGEFRECHLECAFPEYDRNRRHYCGGATSVTDVVCHV